LVFLSLGGLGVAVLAVGLLGAELLHVGHPDIDGLIPIEAAAAFVGAFGFAAAIASDVMDAGTPVEVAAAGGIGIGAALPAAYLALRLARAARNMRTDPTPTRQDLVGCLGVVITPIPAGGYGEVRLRLGGQPVKFNARADRPLPTGAHVFVIDAPSDTSVVVEETPPVANLGSTDQPDKDH
jgi:membrane-bound ClpP family serine protease